MSQEILDALSAKFGGSIVDTEIKYGDTVAVVNAASIVEVATYLRDELTFDMPSFCTCIDRLTLTDGPRFEMVYQIRSMKKRQMIRLKIFLSDDAPKMPTLCGVWPGFNWLEREAFDMYGVTFDGHPDLRRIYLYDEFKGYPLRKDYPKNKRQPLVRREWGNE